MKSASYSEKEDLELLTSAFMAKWYIRTYNQKIHDEREALLDYYHVGGFQDRNPNPFFCSSWYIKKYFTPRDRNTNPLVHYLRWGVKDLLDPSSTFDAQFYAAKFPEARTNPLLHFLEIGLARGYPTQPGIRTNKETHPPLEIISLSSATQPLLANINDAFDEKFYLANNPDVDSLKIDPLQHYLKYGGLEGRRPNQYFDSAWYLKQYPDVAASGQNPLAHYMAEGVTQGRRPFAAFDPEFYIAQNPDARGNPFIHFLRIGSAKGLPSSLAALNADALARGELTAPTDPSSIIQDAFDRDFYLTEYPDVAYVGVDPLLHYLRYGGFEGRRPNSVFDSAWYLAQNPTLAEAGYNPLLHYMVRGAAEGQRPSPEFDTEYYVSRNPDASANPLLHYLHTGRAAGLSINDPTNPRAMSDMGIPSDTRKLIQDGFDEAFYLAEYPDVEQAGINPLVHYFQHGGLEGRNPNAWFDSAWYLGTNQDVVGQKINPLVHYMKWGAAEHRDPSPNFDAAYYVATYPDAKVNPLIYHMKHGHALGHATFSKPEISDYLPSRHALNPVGYPEKIDVIIPVYKGLPEIQDCLASLLADRDTCFYRLIVIDDKSPQPELSKWLKEFCSSDNRIHLLVNEVNLGFVGSVNRGIQYSQSNDVVFLNSDTMVPESWLQRLRNHAYSADKVATVTPFSNNDTICSYPSIKGGPIPFGLNLHQIDDATRKVNAGRAVSVPTGVGFCMYVRRACLDEIGILDQEKFGKGYGEEVDLCRRAHAAGWANLLACDVFVYHAGEVSFGKNSPHLAASRKVLQELYPDFLSLVDQHVRRDKAAPYRFCLSAELMLKVDRPKILHVSHHLGGGIKRHIDDIARILDHPASHFVLSPNTLSFEVCIPNKLDDPILSVKRRDFDFLVAILRKFEFARIHIHHTMGLLSHLRRLIRLLDVPFDFTVHDFNTVCPRINFLQFIGADYCGQPAEHECNSCILGSASAAFDIDTWRLEHQWLLEDANRLIVPSKDTRKRLQLYGLGAQALIASHDFATFDNVSMVGTRIGNDRRIRVGLIGVLAEHKGLSIVRSALKQNREGALDFVLIGHSEARDELAKLGLDETGPYLDEQLVDLIQSADLDVLWYPARWPETYSYTLTAGLQTRLPIVATNLGAFVERLVGRVHIRLIDVHETASTWIQVTRQLVDAARANGTHAVPKFTPDEESINFYEHRYLLRHDSNRRPIRRSVRTKTKILIIPEVLANGAPTPCAYIRLILPLKALQTAMTLDVELGRVEDIPRSGADVVATHRHIARKVPQALAIIDACKNSKARLLYDLDDQLISVSDDHPEYSRLREMSDAVRELTMNADTLWVSTSSLAAQVGALSKRTSVCENGIDGRLWCIDRRNTSDQSNVVRIGYMGTATHAGDFSIIAPVAERVKRRFGDRVKFEVIGVTNSAELPLGFERVDVPSAALRSYPLFVAWYRSLSRWDIGLAPLQDTPFNRGKSSIKCMDYAAGGAPTLASDHTVYKDSIADKGGGMLLGNAADEWEEAICRLVANQRQRRRLRDISFATLATQFTLESQQSWRQALLAEFLQ